MSVSRETFIYYHKGCVILDSVNVYIYESASPYGDWHVEITIDNVEVDSYTSFSFVSVLDYSVRYLEHTAILKECL